MILILTSITELHYAWFFSILYFLTLSCNTLPHVTGPDNTLSHKTSQSQSLPYQDILSYQNRFIWSSIHNCESDCKTTPFMHNFLYSLPYPYQTKHYHILQNITAPHHTIPCQFYHFII